MEDFKSGGESYTLRLEKWERFIIDVQEIMKLLRYKDVRSVLNWCKENNVFVLHQGNTQVVNQVEFILAFYKPLIHHLKRTEKNWKEIFMRYVCGDVMPFIGEADHPDTNRSSYVPHREQDSPFYVETEEGMNRQKPLIVKKSDRVSGLRPWCSKCSREIGGGKCGMTGKSLRTCKNTEEHMYKALVTIPGTKQRRTRELGTRDLTEAMILRREFEEELKSLNYQSTETKIEAEPDRPELLTECMQFYVAFLNNEGVESHMVKKRSDKHLWEVQNFFGKFCDSLKHNKVNYETFRIEALNNRVVGNFHDYILDELKHSNKTYNKIMALMRQFVEWLITQKDYDITNPFKLVQRRVVDRDTTIVTKKEFKALLNAISPENRYQVMPSGERKNRYKPWLAQCFRLALETGLRREEFMCLQFSDIVSDDQGNPLFIKVENYKVNRIRGGEDKSREMKSIPITRGLLELLQGLGIDEYRNTDRFLIGHDEASSRNTLIEFVSKAFAHYWKQTGIDKKMSLKHLRKTYLTALVDHFGDKAPMISDHSGIQVLKDHYVNNERLVSASKDFSIF